MTICRLTDRAIVAVNGDEAEAFLNRMLTRDVQGMDAGEARYAALLSPQGKLLFDFIVLAQTGGVFWLDVDRALATDLVRRLSLFKLRAKVAIEAREDLGIFAAWNDHPGGVPGPAFRDPRHPELGFRIVVVADGLPASAGDAAAYEAHRIALGVPKGGVDFAYGDSFVHDANLDLLHGVDFDKGCYVGQEVVSRVHHRGSARKRIVRLSFYGDAAVVGAALQAGALQIGTVTSVAGRDGLASARLDRLQEAEGAKVPILAGETLVAVALPGGETASA